MSLKFQRDGAYLLFCVLFMFLANCKTQADCRAGTVLVKISCPAGVRKFQVYYTKSGQSEQRLEDVEPTCPLTAIQFSLANYSELAGNGSVNFRVVALDEAGAAIDTSIAKADISGSCAAVTATYAGANTNDAGVKPQGNDASAAPLACNAGQHVCGTECVSNNDPLTCGSSCTSCQAPVNGTATCDGTKCGGVCAEDKKLCAGKCLAKDMACESSCPVGSHDCNGLCPPDTDVNSCGTSCTPCPVPQGAMKASCEAGQCGFVCEAGYHRCGEGCKKDDDASSCGVTCSLCPSSTVGTAACSGGTCSLECKTGYHLCGDECVSNASSQSCGMSCTACNMPNGGQATCDGSSCGASCPAGMKVCKGNCILTSAPCDGGCPTGSHDCNGFCVANNHVNSCGTTSCKSCPVPNGASQATCDGVACSFGCTAGFHKCGDTCNKDDDASACGASCTPCPTDPNGTSVCTTGQCKIACKTGFHLCGNVCVTNNSIDHCGESCSGCQTAPTGGTAGCDGTRCLSVCPSGKPQLCLGACIDASASCSGKCPPGKHDCNGTCVPDDSVNSCGTLCGACAVPQGSASTECKAGGTCDFTCAAGYHKCGSACPANADAMACGPGCKLCPGPTSGNGGPSCVNDSCSVVCNPGFTKCGDGTCRAECPNLLWLDAALGCPRVLTDDGHMVLGDNGSGALIWRKSTGQYSTVPIPSGMQDAGVTTLSGDGTILGFANDSNVNDFGYKWPAAGPPIKLAAGLSPEVASRTAEYFLDFIFPETFRFGPSSKVEVASYARPIDINSAGNFVIGENISDPRKAFYWSSDDMVVRYLKDNQLAIATTDSGKAFLGREGTRLFIFSHPSSLTYLPTELAARPAETIWGTDLPWGDISGDGAKVVAITPGNSPTYEAAIWTAQAGTKQISALLSAANISVAAGYRLGIATAISRDGKVVVGCGTVNEDAKNRRGFRVVLP